MFEVILISFVAVLSILGLTEILGVIKIYLKKPNSSNKVCAVFFLGETDIDEQIDYIISKSVWHGIKKGEYIFVVVPRNIVIKNKSLIEKNYNILFCDFESMSKRMKNLGEDFYA